MSRWIVLNSGAREGQRDNNAINDLGHLTTLFRFLLRTSDVLEGKMSGGETIHITERAEEEMAKLRRPHERVPNNDVQWQDGFHGSREPEPHEFGRPGRQ